MREFEFGINALNLSALKGDWETDSGVEEDVVIGVVSKGSAPEGDIEASFLDKAFGKAGLEVISARRADGNSENLIIQLIHLSRTGQQQIFNSRGLEGAVVGKAQHQISTFEVVSGSEAGTESVVIHYERIMIPPDSRADGEIAQANVVLSPERLFAVETVIGKVERKLGTGIEVSGVGDLILQCFGDRSIQCVRAELEIVNAVMACEIGIQIIAAEPTLLGGDDRSGKRIRPQIGRQIFDREMSIEQQTS